MSLDYIPFRSNEFFHLCCSLFLWLNAQASFPTPSVKVSYAPIILKLQLLNIQCLLFFFPSCLLFLE